MKPLVHALLFICFLGSTFVFSQWDKYPTYGEYVEYMEKWQEDYPQFAKLYDLGPAGEASLNHRLYVIRISDNVDQNEPEPSFLYISTIHGDEVVGYMSMLHFIDYLLINYGKDTLVTTLVDSVDIWIAPLCNPDGTYPRGDNTVQNAQRRNVADNFDLNRNFPCPCMQGDHQYYGLYSYAAKETEAVRKMIDSNNFVLSADLHCGAEGALIPWCAFVYPRPVDNEWFRYVGDEYAETVWDNSPTGYFQMGVSSCCDEWYESHGTFIDYMLYYQNCRDLYLELSTQKLVNESELTNYWDYNYRSFLNYIEQALYGIRGTVTDTLTGEPLNAKVFIENHDTLNSHVYSHLPHGDYYRPIYAGTYDVTFSCDGYHSKTFTDVYVENNRATILNVELSDIPINITSKIKSISGISIDIRKNVILIKSDFPLGNDLKIEIYDLAGRKVIELPVTSNKINWNKNMNNGIYIVRLVGKDINKQFKVMFTK